MASFHIQPHGRLQEWVADENDERSGVYHCAADRLRYLCSAKITGRGGPGGFLYSVISMREYTVDCSEVWTTRPVVETARSLLI